jgi:hypothetical protein
MAAFLLGRHWLRDWARRRLASLPQVLAVEQAVSREGLKLVLLTRLSPAFPFSLLNLAYGLSEVSLRDYAIGLLAILPGTVLFCSLGALAGDVARFGEVLSGEADLGTWVLRVVGLGATVASVALVGRGSPAGPSAGQPRLSRVPRKSWGDQQTCPESWFRAGAGSSRAGLRLRQTKRGESGPSALYAPPARRIWHGRIRF